MAKSFNSVATMLDFDDRVNFGKHNGKTWQQVVQDAPDYIIWCIGNIDTKFKYDVIVAAIKRKYELKKPSEQEFEKKLHAKHHIHLSDEDERERDQVWTYPNSDNWDDDIPF